MMPEMPVPPGGMSYPMIRDVLAYSTCIGYHFGQPPLATGWGGWQEVAAGGGQRASTRCHTLASPPPCPGTASARRSQPHHVPTGEVGAGVWGSKNRDLGTVYESWMRVSPVETRSDLALAACRKGGRMRVANLNGEFSGEGKLLLGCRPAADFLIAFVLD